MTNTHHARSGRLLLVMALLIGFAALSAGDADARHRKHREYREHRRGKSHRVVVVQRPAPYYVGVAQRACPAPTIYVGPERFHWSASLGLYVPNVWLRASYGEYAPRGSVYYDPYCGRPYRSLSSYRVHMHDCGHPAALMLASGPSAGPYGVMRGDEGCDH
jgi:hypothetical protein